MSERRDYHDEIRFWAAFPLLLFTIVAPTILVFGSHDLAAAGTLLGVGAVCLIMLRLDDLSEFAGFGIKAKMERTISRAEVTIKNLQALSLALAKPIISEIAMQGQMMEGLSTEFRGDLHSAVIRSLRDLGISDQNIADADELWRWNGVRKVLSVMSGRLQQLSQGPAIAEIKEVERAGPDEFDQKQVEAILTKHSIRDGEIDEFLKDLKVMRERGDIRRPEVIPFNLSVSR